MSLVLKHLKNNPKNKKRTKVLGVALDKVIYLAAFVAPFALVPQIIDLYSSRNASVLSLPTWIILACGNCLWLIYGLYHNERPIILTNFLLALFNFTIVTGIFLYR